MPVCDACHRELGDVFVVEDGSTLCARCLEMGINDNKPMEERSRMMLVLDGDDELAS
ncbi:MAG: hypothetical protein JOY86_09015 [Candidatus Eremiobacteraeota bacterium]|nr:hypothetical protein [Candidatus Eremiobacteraeota bacterium]